MLKSIASSTVHIFLLGQLAKYSLFSPLIGAKVNLKQIFGKP